jgi:hypothetical protein
VAQDSVDPQANNVTRRRDDIAVQWRWNLADIYQSWDEWREACRELERCIEAYGAKQGTLAQGADSLLEVMQLGDELGQLCTRVYFYPALMYDQNQRDNEINARRQEAAMLHARATQASSWFNPELLAIPLERVQQWMKDNATLAQYDFALQEVYRQQEHVLDEGGERLLSLGSRFQSSPGEAYAALTTADARFPKVTLQDGDEVTVTYGRYRAILAENRDQRDREAAFRALYGLYEQQINTHASLYAAVVERDWFLARARGYGSCLEAALHGNNIPEQVVDDADRDHTRGRRAAAVVTIACAKRRWGWKATTSTMGRFRFWISSAATPTTQVKDWIDALGGAFGAGLSKTRCSARSTSVGSTSTKTKASARVPIQRPFMARIPTCCSTTTTRSMTCSRWLTRWAIRCTRSSGASRRSRTFTLATRSSSPRWPRRSTRRCSWTCFWLER